MIHLFEQSFYNGYFTHIPENIICSSLEQVYRNMRMERAKCPGLFEEMFELEAALFLNSYFGSSELCFTDKDGNKVPVKSLNSSGAKSTIKKDSIDSSVSREFYKPDFLPGEDPSDFPLGNIKEQLKELKEQCDLANGLTMGIGADLPCGWDNCKSIERFMPNNNGFIRGNCKKCR